MQLNRTAPLAAVASIDLGGGSVQEAYAMTQAEAAAAPDKQYLTELHSGGKTYHVYVYRWGGDAAVRRHAAIVEAGSSGSGTWWH